MGSLRFVPADGEWTVLAAWPIIATLPSGVPSTVLDAVWDAVQAEGATLESVVSSIPVRGDDGVSSFSVVGFDSDGPRTVLAVVRGAGVVDVLSVGGSRRFGSQGVEPWALARFADVTGLTAGTLPPVPESSLRVPTESDRLVSGVVRASRVVWAASSDDFVDAPDDDDTIITPRVVEIAPAPHPLSHSPQSHSPLSPPPPLTFPSAPALFEVRIGDEEAWPLEHPVVIGRRPRPRHGYSGDESRLVEVPSPSHAVSANHVEIAPVGATVVVTDLRSSNGTVVTVPGTRSQRLRQGDSVVVTGSAIVEIGDGNVIHISSRDRGTSGITA